MRANGAPPRLNRIAYAAAHVVANPLADNEPWLDTAVDWERTIAFRHYLWDLGLGVAEAMDTAQRGMGLDWNGARELIRRSLEAAKSRPGALIASGAGTEQLEASANDDRRCDPRLRDADRGDRGDGRTHRLDGEPGAGQSGESSGRLRQGLCAHPRPGEGAGDHPLAGRDVRPALAGYWGSGDHDVAMATALDVIRDNVTKVDGIKISLCRRTRRS